MGKLLSLDPLREASTKQLLLELRRRSIGCAIAVLLSQEHGARMFTLAKGCFKTRKVLIDDMLQEYVLPYEEGYHADR